MVTLTQATQYYYINRKIKKENRAHHQLREGDMYAQSLLFEWGCLFNCMSQLLNFIEVEPGNILR
jgi:hypothetical protein